MKPLLQGLVAGTVVAIVHALILNEGWALWDVSIISISALSTGVFFILGMIFQSTLQDYKKATVTITQLQGNFLSMHDFSIIAIQERPDCDPEPFRRALLRATELLRHYIQNNATLEETEAAMTALIPLSCELRRVLPSAQSNLLLKLHEDIRQALSYLSFLKDHNFPMVGYVFLWFFASFIMVLQLFSETSNRLLDSLFLFSLSSILVFFIQFIRDLEHPFLCNFACFALDVWPLEYAASILCPHPPCSPHQCDATHSFSIQPTFVSLHQSEKGIAAQPAFR